MIILFSILPFLFLFFAFLLLRRTSHGILFSVDNIVICGAALLWGVVFPIVYVYSLNNQNNEYLSIISNYNPLELLVYYLCISLFLFSFVKTFRIVANRQQFDLFITESRVEYNGGDTSRFYFTAIILFMVGVISDYLYCKAYGGYLGYLEYSAYIRSGVTNLVNNPWSFLIVFRDCVTISSYIFFSQIKKDEKIDYVCATFFAISFIYSLMVLYANRGRLTLLVYLAVFVVTYLVRRRRMKFVQLKSMSYLLLACLLFGLGFSFISNWVGRGSDVSIFDSLCNECSFVFSNFKLLLNDVDVDNLRLFLDIITYPLFLLPSSWWRKILPLTASDFMTILVSGSQKGEGGVFGETPIDAVSIGYLQFGIIGVCVFAIFFGIVAAKLYSTLSKIHDGNVRLILQVYVVLDIFVRSLVYADSYNIVQRSFSLVVFFLVYWGCGILCQKKIYPR